MKTPDTDSMTSSLFITDRNGGSAEDFRGQFERKPFLFSHCLSEARLFDTACIKALARRLPGKISFSGDLSIEQGFSQPGGKQLSFEEALDQVETGHSWIILKKVHQDPEYRPILRQCLVNVEKLIGRRLGPLIESRTMSLILSSPGQVTPYHVDADCNFLFQIRGRKTFYAFDGRDRSVLPEQEEERFWAGDMNAAKYREENQAKAQTFNLKPGNGVHVPVMFPHWVKNGDNPSVSLSINFRFHGHIRGDVYRMNHFMRKLGFHPRTPGESMVADSLKKLIVSPPRLGIQMIRRVLRG
jgi:hypothetical protein